MPKRIFVFLLVCLFTINNNHARPLKQPGLSSFIIVLKEPSLSRSAFDERGNSLYKGISKRKNRRVEHVVNRRRKLRENLSNFENRLRKISPDIITRRRFTGLINGISLEMPGRIASRIQSLPEVLAIVPNRKYNLLLTKSNDLMNAPSAWQFSGGPSLAGQGIKIGIIDTGIDNSHIMFNDEGYELPDGFPLGDTNFTNNKIIVARVFTKAGDSNRDSTPSDRNGHGTHVASCAAGNLNTLSPLGLISGVAPNAYLGNYKVFTSDFTTLEQIIGALEACVEDGMDVVNLSLGSESYVNTLLDPEALAIKNAIKAGVVVVAAAGNSGETETIGAPGQIPEVITVGSLTNSHNGGIFGEISIAMMNVYADGSEILSGEEIVLGPNPDFFSRPFLGRFELIDADNYDGRSFGGDQDGLVCESLLGGYADNKWVLVQRGICTFTSKIDRVQEIGGWGALIYNNRDAEEGPDELMLGPSVPGTQIPSYFMSRNTGLLIKDAIKNSRTVEVEFYAAAPLEREETAFQLSTFSSLGPSLGYSVKPDIVAIGEGSYAATQNDFPGEFQINFFEYTAFDLSGFGFSNGTSFSSPRVAGAAALIKQMNPSWKPEDIKSAIVISGERPSNVASMSGMERGGGHIDPVKAMNVPLIVTPSTISWENVLVDGPTESERTISLRNVSQQPQSFFISMEFSRTERIESFDIIPNQFDLAPSESIEVMFRLKLNSPSLLGEFEDISGDVIINMDNQAEVLRVPVWARVMKVPASEGNVLLIDDDGSDSIEDQYIEAINLAGYESTLWDVNAINVYPSLEYMQNFQAVSWFMATTSLNAVSDNQVRLLNYRTRFNVELTQYLAQGGRLLISGMDWSDQHEHTPFGQQVLHILGFNRDPFVSYSSTGDILSQETTLDISEITDSPIGQGISGLNAEFDANVPNMTDILILDRSDLAQPALITNQNPEDVIGITVETGSYRAVFFAFALERISNNGMDIIMKNSLDWLMEGSQKLLSIRSVEPEIQNDNSVPLTVILTVEGINFLVGHDVLLNDIPVEIKSINMDGNMEILVPAGLPHGLYDITLRSPDGQNTTLSETFQVGNPV
ncbi:MAG: S8 family serine peptidase [Planctomycetes bacterium]|nr:S8 family serine peptidase [Planctomycetota bacterium]